jgi:hypothetical protein
MKNNNNKAEKLRKKSFFSRFFDKLDKKMEEKARSQSCCSGPKDKGSKSCCN